jgi:hypothetical protein
MAEVAALAVTVTGMQDKLQTARKKLGELTRDDTAGKATPARTIQTEAYGATTPALTKETDAGPPLCPASCTPSMQGHASRPGRPTTHNQERTVFLFTTIAQENQRLRFYNYVYCSSCGLRHT